MAQGVTYADLRFMRNPPEKTGRPGTGGEGETAYENVQGPRPLEGKEAPKEGKGSEPWVRRAALGLGVTCLFLLLATSTVGLGVRYWQVSGQLHRSSQDQADRTRVLERRVSAQNESLAKMEAQLHQAEMDLNSTRVTLRETSVAAERTQRHLEKVEEQLREANRSLEATKREKEETEAELGRATSCQEIGCCPSGWTLFRWKCLWVSEEERYWTESKVACERRASQLLILKDPWDARALWEKVAEVKKEAEAESSLRSKEYWIGLHETWSKEKDDYVFTWVDGSHYEGSEVHPARYYGRYGILINGVLARAENYAKRCYICEKAASPEGPLFPH